MTFLQPYISYGQYFASWPAATAQAVTKPRDTAAASGRLEGTVTVTCAPGTNDCELRPYHVGLFIQDEQKGVSPIHVFAAPRFSIALAPGIYTITSADVRGACCLPVLPQPITATVISGRTTHVDVRFQPGPGLPIR